MLNNTGLYYIIRHGILVMSSLFSWNFVYQSTYSISIHSFSCNPYILFHNLQFKNYLYTYVGYIYACWEFKDRCTNVNIIVRVYRDWPGHLASILYIWKFQFSLSLCISFYIWGLWNCIVRAKGTSYWWEMLERVIGCWVRSSGGK